MIEDPAGAGIWTVNRNGLYFFEFKSGKMQTFFDIPALKEKSLTVLSPSKDGNIWIFDNTGRKLLLFDSRKKNLRSGIDLSRQLPNVFVNAIFQENNGRVWISSWTNQVFVVDLDLSKVVFSIKKRPGDSRSIASQFFWDMCQDEDGTLWFATMSGISKCNPEKNLYRLYGMPGKIPMLDSTSISVVATDPMDSSLWLATLSKHLINYHPLSGKYRIINVGEDLHAERPGGVRNIRFYADGAAIVNVNNFDFLAKVISCVVLLQSSLQLLQIIGNNRNGLGPVQRLPKHGECVFILNGYQALVRPEADSPTVPNPDLFGYFVIEINFQNFGGESIHLAKLHGFPVLVLRF